jgi:hypothetical protein
MPSTPKGASGSLTFDLRELVWGIESEVAQITSLCRRIDERVVVVNAARREAVARLAQLDELFALSQDPDLTAWLEAVAAAPLPQVTERFPDRLYTD